MGNFIAKALAMWFIACGVIGTALVLKIGIIAATGAGCASMEVFGYSVMIGEQCQESSND